MPSKKSKHICAWGDGKKATTGEHIHSVWMHDIFDQWDLPNRRYETTGVSVVRHATTGDYVLAPHSRMHHGQKVQSVKLPVVCKDCNSGWMSVLETDACPYLEPLIHGYPHVLSSAGRKLVTQWIVMKAMVFDAVSGEAILSEERTAFFKTRAIPAHLEIWIAPLESPAVDHFKHAARLNSSIRPNDLRGENNVRSITLSFGKLFVYCLYSRFAYEMGAWFDLNCMCLLWPSHGGPIGWPFGTELLSKNDADGIRNMLVDKLFLNRALIPNVVFGRAVTPLRIIDAPRANASIWTLPPHRQHFFNGSCLDDLVCGNVACGAVLCPGVSEAMVLERFTVTTGQLLLACPSCQQFNELIVRGTTRRGTGKKKHTGA